MKVVRGLGEGAFALVEEVSLHDGSSLARKTLRPSPHILQFVSLEELKARFQREVKYQWRISHPNVVAIKYADLDADPPYCLMELAEGTLADDLMADRTLGGDPQAAIYDLLAGLEALESAGFTHRDLKPQNVLKIRNMDGSIRYALSDFGLVTAGSGASTSLTGTGVTGGTPYYAAPELNSDFKRATIAADIYAIGAILHDIFDGRGRIPYSELDCIGPIGEVIRRCTRKNPVRRYSSVAELREAVFGALSSGPVRFNSKGEEAAIDLLRAQGSLTDDAWDAVYFAVDDNDNAGLSSRAIFQFLTVSHIEELHASAPQILKALGMSFSDHAFSESFNFDYCDVLGARLEKFYEKGDVELKAMALLALLQLGISHNRWYVERVFCKLAGATADDAVIGRFLVEADVRGYKIDYALKRMEQSIGVGRESLNKQLAAIPR